MKHFLAISDLSPGEVQDLLDLAIKPKAEYFKTGSPPYFKGKVLWMIFLRAHSRLHAQKAILARLFGAV